MIIARWGRYVRAYSPTAENDADGAEREGNMLRCRLSYDGRKAIKTFGFSQKNMLRFA